MYNKDVGGFLATEPKPERYDFTHEAKFMERAHCSGVKRVLDYKDEGGDTVFEDYVKTFFLEDYVDENYNIKPLFSRKKRDSLVRGIDPLVLSSFTPHECLPQTQTELDEYLKNANSRILSRGERIIEELRKRI